MLPWEQTALAASGLLAAFLFIASAVAGDSSGATAGFILWLIAFILLLTGTPE